MESSVALLYATVADTYKRLKLLVMDVDQEELFFKGVNNEMNSIGQLLRHLAVVDLHWVYRFR
ncbi:DinB family protein, partial [Bacillus aryabhattai]|nr:DinB family protein [Priestia aryabhattai]